MQPMKTHTLPPDHLRSRWSSRRAGSLGHDLGGVGTGRDRRHVGDGHRQWRAPQHRSHPWSHAEADRALLLERVSRASHEAGSVAARRCLGVVRVDSSGPLRDRRDARPPVRCRGANDGRESTLVDVRPVRSGNHRVARLLDVPRHGVRRPGKAWPGGAAPLAHRRGEPPVLRAWPGPRGGAGGSALSVVDLPGYLAYWNSGSDLTAPLFAFGSTTRGGHRLELVEGNRHVVPVQAFYLSG